MTEFKICIEQLIELNFLHTIVIIVLNIMTIKRLSINHKILNIVLRMFKEKKKRARSGLDSKSF